MARCRARYQQSEKGQAKEARYRKSDKCRAKEARARARYWASEKGRAKRKHTNARRIDLGGVYRGLAQTVEQASAINAHVKERIRAFTEVQRAEASARVYVRSRRRTESTVPVPCRL